MAANQRWMVVAIAVLTGCVYLGVIAAGVGMKHLPVDPLVPAPGTDSLWTPPPPGSVPAGDQGSRVGRGELLFDETPIYASAYARARLSCSSCHAEGGMQPFAAPMIGVVSSFPHYSRRAGRAISLEDRIEECFVRSENGRPLAPAGEPMRDLVAYLAWLSQPQPGRAPFRGRGLLPMPRMQPDPVRGGEVYGAQCAGCHGSRGEGKPYLFPPLWGPDSFNDGAGMNEVGKMAEFVHHNMPQNRMGVLSVQQAWDVSAYIHAQPRPVFDRAYRDF